MFSNIGINSQLQLQRPYKTVSIIDTALSGDLDNVFRFGDTSLYPDYGFTVCHWYFAESESSVANYTTGRETTSANRQHQILIWNDGRIVSSLSFVTGVASTQYILNIDTNVPIIPNKWYFVGISATALSGSEKKDMLIFDENGLVGSGTTTGVLNYPSINSNANFRYHVGGVRDVAANMDYTQRQNSHAVWNSYKTPEFIKGIWNYGRGLQYDDLTIDQKTNLVEWWNLNDWNGTNCVGSIAENLTRNTLGTRNIFSVDNASEKLYIFITGGTRNVTIPSGYSKLQYLIVGGGGSGGGTITNNSASGGGGGGELKEGEITGYQTGTYTITVGVGGTAVANNVGSRGNDGGNSIIQFPDTSTIISNGGRGGAGGAATATNATANEGGGGGSSVLAFVAGGTGTNQGGTGTNTTAGAGGGGAGGDGAVATSTTATPNGGGAALASTYFGSQFGAGGGSFAVHGTARVGVAGINGSGDGSSGKNRVAANNAGAAGGSGIVIIKLIK